jgi:hypothetical protein
LNFFCEQLGTMHTLIERSRICTARPRVGYDNFLRGVRDGSWEFTTLEERKVEMQVEHMLKTVVYVNSTCVCFCIVCIVSGISDRGEKKTKNKAMLNLTGNPRSIRGHMCGTCRRTLIAALSTIRTSSTRRSATSMDPSLTILERSRCLCKETVSVKNARKRKEMKKVKVKGSFCLLCGVCPAVAAGFHDIDLA